MSLGKDRVFVAGPPNFIDERQAYWHPDDPEIRATLERQKDAMEGWQGGELWALAKSDGQLMRRYALGASPVFDGMAAAGGRLYVSTTDGRVLCLAADSDRQLKTVQNRPVTVAWNHAENPSYLLPPEEPKEGDFDSLARAKVVAADLGYRVSPKGKNQIAAALKKLETPATGSVTFTTRMKVLSKADGGLQNGFLAFGDGTIDAKLIKCGVRIKLQKALIIQGPLKTGTTKAAALEISAGGVSDVTVSVDLASQQVTYVVNGVTVHAAFERRLKAITHVGYVVDNAVVEFAPIDVTVP